MTPLGNSSRCACNRVIEDVELCNPTLRVSVHANAYVESRNHVLSSCSSIRLTALYFHMPLYRRGSSKSRSSDRGASLPVILANMDIIDMIYQIAVTIDASTTQAGGDWLNAEFEKTRRACLMKWEKARVD